MTLTNIIETGMNNPECAFFVGATFGGGFHFQMIMVIIGLYILYKFVDKLAIEPIIEKIKRKWYLKRNRL